MSRRSRDGVVPGEVVRGLRQAQNSPARTAGGLLDGCDDGSPGGVNVPCTLFYRAACCEARQAGGSWGFFCLIVERSHKLSTAAKPQLMQVKGVGEPKGEKGTRE